jgi:hypothetical protein
VLAPVETLTFDSDFTAYLQPKVGEALRRDALRKLFRDPRFNVMDGLDVYIDDYSIPDPISAEMVRGLVQSRNIFDPPQTRINAAGYVEDVPADERVAIAAPTGADAPAALPAPEGSVVAVPAPPAWPAAAVDAADAATATAPAAAPVPDAVTRDPAAPEAPAQTRPEAAPRATR